MQEIKFQRHSFPARKDLLHFIEEKLDKKVYEKIGQNPKAWLEELNFIHYMLSRENMAGGSGIEAVPEGEPDFQHLGNEAFLYRGKYDRSRGLWIREDLNADTKRFTGKECQWKLYRIGTRAKMFVNEDFKDVPAEVLLPENFEKTAKRVKKTKDGQEAGEKRPIFRFEVTHDGSPQAVYAKGAYFILGYYYDHARPTYRLTSLSDVVRTGSKKEMEITRQLAKAGIRVPAVIGYYESLTEEFLFLEEVKGQTPDQYFGSHRREIIEQDARMLALLSLNGFRKQGFTDFDDKIFDGQNLHLIDVEECSDLYYSVAPDFRAMLINPQKNSDLVAFRRQQRSLFKTMLKDALYRYRETLTPTQDDQVNYVLNFYDQMKWKKPKETEINKLLHFPANYMTMDSFMSMMSDTD